jgi:hypothetical protein
VVRVLEGMKMSDKIQVRPGVWLTRGCEQLEVRPSGVDGWPWLSVCGRTLWHYRDDGRVDDRGVMDEDLVEFIRPLPGEKSTTETLQAVDRQAAYEQGFGDGKSHAFRKVHNWLRPFVGAGAEDAAALLDAVPRLVKRLAECEGVEI